MRSIQGPALCMLLAAAAMLAACRSEEKILERPTDYYSRPLPDGKVALEKIAPEEYPDFSVEPENPEALLQAIDESLAYYKKPSSKNYFPYLNVTHDDAVQSLVMFRRLIETGCRGKALHREIVSRFDVYRSVGCDGRGTVLFTGYYEPVFQGSLKPDARFHYPLYRLPPDLAKDDEGKPLGKRTAAGIVPYETREEIETGGVLDGKGLELVWLKDPFEAYIIHVQGSARILLPEGGQMRVGYAGKTDRPYRSVGEALIKDQKIGRDDLSLFAMKEFFAKHPEEVSKYLRLNQNYVFFTEREGGPFGSLNAKVTPMRTIATDKSVFPRGALAFAVTSLPMLSEGHPMEGTRPFKGFVLDQDTGGAIRSAGRCDLFIGTGAYAEKIAGRVHSEGMLYYLFLKKEVLMP